MNLIQVFIEAFRAMNANRLRTSLTMLGIIIGITSVVMMLAVGESARKFISKELEVLGSNLMIIAPGANRTQGVRARAGTAPSLSVEDALALNSLPSLNGAAPALQGFFQLTVGNENSNNAVLGITPEMFVVRNWKIAQGSYFSESDMRSAARMVIIGKKIAEQFFYKTNAVGQFVRIDNVPFQVVGVLQGEGRMFDGGDLGERAIGSRLPLELEVGFIRGVVSPSDMDLVLAGFRKCGSPGGGRYGRWNCTEDPHFGEGKVAPIRFRDFDVAEWRQRVGI